MGGQPAIEMFAPVGPAMIGVSDIFGRAASVSREDIEVNDIFRRFFLRLSHQIYVE